MNKFCAAAISAVAATLATSVYAADQPCTGGYRIFINRISPFVDKSDDEDLATLMRRGLSVFEACEAGDNFSPHDLWHKIAAEMEAKAKK